MAKSGCPKRVKFQGRTCNISFEDLHGVDGLCFPQRQHIMIQKSLIHDEERDTALHECLHWIDYLMQLGLTEEQVRGVATALYGFLRDNPQFTKYLLEKDPNE